ncbi:MAG: hypothetical protein WA632_01505, partial [Gallionella sp.]
MVSSQQKTLSITTHGASDTGHFLNSLVSAFAPSEVGVIGRACELAEPLYLGQCELTGNPLMQ